MPDIDKLMEEWPPEFEEVLKEVSSSFMSLLHNFLNEAGNLYHD